MEEPEADDPIMISALQHYSYCPRQCALIHLEQTFEENRHTLRGRAVHERVDQPEMQVGEGIRIEYALSLFSERLGLVGKADAVEIRPNGQLYPVEYKHGRKKAAIHDDVQLAAQAMCLEEMTGKKVPTGAIYHFSSRRRREVSISPELRKQVEEIVSAVRAMLAKGELPPPTDDPRKCQECSLREVCQPELGRASARMREEARMLYAPEDEAV